MGVVIRRALLLAASAVLVLPPAAPAQTQTLMPGVTYTREVEFTPHGPVVLHVIRSPRPGGLWGLHPAVGNGINQGTRPLTAIQAGLSVDATVAGTNGDRFNPKLGYPTGMLLQSGVLKSPPIETRSTVGIDTAGNLRVQRVQFDATWKGTGQRRPLNAFNQKPGTNGISLYTPAWGSTTPALPGDYEIVLNPFPPTAVNTDLSGVAVATGQNGGSTIPPTGAVLVARGVTAQKLAAEVPLGTTVAVRLILKPLWSDVVDAFGGGPLIVRNGKPVFRADEAFAPDVILSREPRTAIGQTADGHIVQVVADGGQPGYSVGMTNFEMAQTLVQLGAVTGSALDSGSSSAAAFDGQLLSRPAASGEPAIKECVCVFYYGVYAPPPDVPVLSPNGDGVDEIQGLAYKTVRPSTVAAKLIGPDKVARITDTEQRTPGVYRATWNGLTAAGAAEQEGLWRWTVTATDDLGRTSTITRTFWLNDTLGFLRVPARATVRKGGRPPVVATFKVTHPARVVVRIETTSGVVLRTISRQAAAPAQLSITWDGTTSAGVAVYSGRYVVDVTTVNSFGSATLSKPLAVRQITPPPKKKPRKKKPRTHEPG
jgi:phosphodiester glycosidase/flagellar hook capping protein FlgD